MRAIVRCCNYPFCADRRAHTSAYDINACRPDPANRSCDPALMSVIAGSGLAGRRGHVGTGGPAVVGLVLLPALGAGALIGSQVAVALRALGAVGSRS